MKTGIRQTRSGPGMGPDRGRKPARRLAALCLMIWMMVPAGPVSAQQAEHLEQYRHWHYGCNQAGRCFALHNSGGIRLIFARDGAGGRTFASVVVPPNGQNGQPVTLRLDNNVMMQLTVSACTATFCEAVISEDKTSLVESYFREAKEGVVAYLSDGKIVVAAFQLTGFSSAIDRLKNGG